MKKLLVASTALVAFAAVNSAQAADPIKLSVGGFQEAWVGYTDQDDDGQNKYANLLVQTDTELSFQGSTKLDNGLTIAARIDVTADRGDNGAEDDSYMQISSDTLGLVRLGATKGASYGLSHAAPDVGIGHTDGDVENWIARPSTGYANGVVGSTYSINQTQPTSNSGNDGHKVVYLSPNFGGVQFGASYGLNANGVNGQAVNVGGTNTGSDIMYDAAIAYNGEFGGVSIGADFGYHLIDNGGTTGPAVDDEVTKRGGLSLGVAGFTLAGSYMDKDNFATVKDQGAKAWDLGVSYATGPYAVSVSYLDVSVDDAANSSTEDTEQSWMVSGSYDLGAGVTARASVFAIEYDDASATGTTVNDNDGFGIVTGLTVAF
ncbi:MAG: porin [Methylocystaceae bacterium]|nr:porin [Methylocystaceae bacterium]